MRVGSIGGGFVGQRAAAADDADISLLVNAAGMMPILHLPGEMMPGQFGPIRRVFLKSTTEATRTMSMAGMPSVMQTMSGSSASAAPRWRLKRRVENENHGGVCAVAFAASATC